MKIKSQFVSLFLLSFFSLNAMAWWGLGHMVVADIAYQNLTSNARNKVDSLVNTFQIEYPEIKSFNEMSVWADTIQMKQGNSLYTHWHYINVFLRSDNTTPRATIDTDNVAWAINGIKATISNPQVNKFEQARLLVFLIHLVGDVHQPLHTVTRISAAHPDGDKGGNLFQIIYNRNNINLHQLWDSDLGLFGEENLPRFREISQNISNTYPASYFGNKIYNLNTQDWLKEGMSNSVQYVYKTPENRAPSAEYTKNAKRVIEERVALAGYRLANLLNQLLG